MARKRTKKEAKERIRDLPLIPDLQLPIGGPTIGELAEAFVDADPLNRLADDPEPRKRPMQGPSKAEFLRNQALMQAMVNDPNFTMTKEMVEMINNPDILLVSDGSEMMKVNGRDVIRGSGQFRRDMLLPRKRARKKTKTDKNMAKALAQANKELRKKNGELRKGKTQADVMRRAHRLRKKMS